MRKKILNITLWMMVLGLTVATIWPFLEQSTWIADLLLQTRIWTLYASALGVLIALGMRRFMAGGLLITLTLIHYLLITQAIQPAPRLAQHSTLPRFRVMTMNLWKHNNDLSRAVNAVRIVNPDMVLIQEANKERFNVMLAELKKDYPYYAPSKPEYSDYYERAFFSKYPFKEEWDIKVKRAYDLQHVVFHAYFSKEVEFLHVVGVHFLSPRTQERTEFRNEQIVHLSDWLRTQRDKSRPMMLVGDMNSVTWHPLIESLMAYNDMFHTQASLTETPLTWPSYFPQWLRIPIDQMMLKRGWCSGDLQRAPDTGSDHAALYVDVAPCEKEHF
jgi:endonuclease/exonuclease/phosphatase (EEP) superfamily protein YafD